MLLIRRPSASILDYLGAIGFVIVFYSLLAFTLIGSDSEPGNTQLQRAPERSTPKQFTGEASCSCGDACERLTLFSPGKCLWRREDSADAKSLSEKPL